MSRELNDKLIGEWHPTKNGLLTPKDVTCGSGKKVWWLCKKGHEWEDTIFHRTDNRGCPFCSGKKACEDNCLSTLNPELSKEWHPTKNGELTPKDVTCGSGKKVWWLCAKGHEWEAIVKNRMNGTGCPFCSGKKACEDNCLSTLNPKLAKEWHPTKNGLLTPKDVTCGSRKKVWWLCEKGHEWEAPVSDRIIGNGCPYCSGRRACNSNSLESLNSGLAKEWHPTKNGKLTPKDVTCGSNKKVWWLCEKGHEWVSLVCNRTNGNGCPYCAGKKVCDDNCLATLNPELAKEWHPTKNGKLTPKGVTCGSNKKVWWLCKKGHDWEAPVSDRIIGNGCPYCVGQKICDDNCLATLNSELAKEWHPTKNGKLTPKDVTCFSGKKVWWLCKKGHDWKAVISSRSNGCGCPYCSNSTSYPDKLIYFIMSKVWGIENVFLRHKIRLLDNEIEVDCFIKPLNIAIEYDGYFYHKNKKKDEEKATKFVTANYNYISIREKGLSPLNVAGIKTFILDNNSDLDIKLAIVDVLHYIKNSFDVCNDIIKSIDELVYYLSYAENIKFDVLNCYVHNNNIRFEDYPILFEEWDTDKNKGLSLSDFNKSHFNAWWTCKKGHSWKATVKDRVRGTGCPYCAGKKVCKENSLDTLKPELVKEWHPMKNENLSPKDVTRWSDRSVWWMCEKGHEWESRISNRTKGNGCPFCGGKKACEDNCLATLNPELAKEWHPTKNGELAPKDVTCGSNKKVWWLCEKGHDWEATINNRTNGRKCPYCSGKKIV